MRTSAVVGRKTTRHTVATPHPFTLRRPSLARGAGCAMVVNYTAGSSYVEQPNPDFRAGHTIMTVVHR